MSRGLAGEVQRFVSVGVLNTAIGISAIYAAKWFMHLGDVAANALGYSIGLLTSFALNGRWTFAYRGANLPALAKYVGATAIAYAANLATVMAAIRLVGVNGYLAQAIGIIPYTLTVFLASKYFVFREPG